MDRKDFIKRCGLACVGGGAVATLLQACGLSNNLDGKISGDDLVVPVTDFETSAAGEVHYKKYIVLHNDKLKFPICVYRTDAQHYTALWLQCTHQGAELQVFGNKLQCPAHGSEFDSAGNATNGPASKNLRAFPVRIENNQLKISLKAI